MRRKSLEGLDEIAEHVLYRLGKIIDEVAQIQYYGATSGRGTIYLDSRLLNDLMYTDKGASAIRHKWEYGRDGGGAKFDLWGWDVRTCDLAEERVRVEFEFNLVYNGYGDFVDNPKSMYEPPIARPLPTTASKSYATLEYDLYPGPMTRDQEQVYNTLVADGNTPKRAWELARVAV